MTDSANPYDQFGYDDGGGAVGASSIASAPIAPSADPPTATVGAPRPLDAKVSIGEETPAQKLIPDADAKPNPYDQFGYDDGGAKTSSAPPIQSPHPGALANDPGGDSTLAGMAKGAATAVIKGLGDIPGFAGNLHDTSDYLANWVGSKFTGETPEAYAARHQAAFEQAQADARNQPGILGAISRGIQGVTPPSPPSGSAFSNPVLAQTGEYVPQSIPGRIGMAGVEAGVGSLGPSMGSAASPQAIQTAVKAIPAVAASGAIGQGASDVTGSPFAGMVAGIATPIGLHVGAEGARAAAGRVGDFVAPMDGAGPFNKPQPVLLRDGSVALDSSGNPLMATPAQQRIAGQSINDAASDPEALRANLLVGRQGPLAPAAVPDYEPTTFQKTGDTGLGQLERQVSRDPAAKGAFLTRGEQQNAARIAHLGSIQSDGSPVDVAQGFRAMRDTMDAQHAADLAQAEQQAAASREAIPGKNANPEVLGTALRDPIAAARKTAKTEESTLWKAVPKDLAVPAAPITDAVKEIMGERSNSAKPIDGEEARLLGVAGSYGDHTTFGDIKDLRSDISAEIRKQRGPGGDANSVRRLSILRGSVEDAIDHGVENQAALDQIAVKRGTMAPDATMEARLRDKWNVASAAGNVGTNAVWNSGGARGSASSAASTPSRGSGADVSAGGGLGEAQGNPGVSPPAPVAGPEAAAALKAASDATKARATTFDNPQTAGVVAKTLKQGQTAGSYDRSVALAPSDIFHKGPTGGEDVRAYLKAGGSVDALQEAASASLRQYAMKDKDGVFDQGKVATWIKDHTSAARELPATLRDKFINTIKAQNAVDETIGRQTEQANDLKKSAVAPFLGLTEPSSVVKQVGAVFGTKTAPETMAKLATQAAASDAQSGTTHAVEGLRRAVIDHIQSKFLGNEAGTSGTPQMRSQKFIDFLRDPGNKAALSKVFTPEEIGKMSAITQTLEQEQRSVSGSKIKGGSDTAQNLSLASKANEGRSIIGRLAVEAGAAAAGGFAGGPITGAATWLGTRALGALRQAGITRINQLMTEGILHPELGAALLEKAPQLPDRGVAALIGLRARQIATSQAESQGRKQPKPEGVQ